MKIKIPLAVYTSYDGYKWTVHESISEHRQNILDDLKNRLEMGGAVSIERDGWFYVGRCFEAKGYDDRNRDVRYVVFAMLPCEIVTCLDNVEAWLDAPELSQPFNPPPQTLTAEIHLEKLLGCWRKELRYRRDTDGHWETECPLKCDPIRIRLGHCLKTLSKRVMTWMLHRKRSV